MAYNLIGERFGKLLVVARAENSAQGKRKWICVCDCGKTKEKPVTSNDLISGKVRSCGCFYKESNKGRNAKHAMTNSRLYIVWFGMRQRCRRNPLYIAKNITVCDKWDESFEAFRDWAIANGYSDNLTIDRIDNDKGYSPDNCRWATMKEQQNNRTNNRIVGYNGDDYSVAELAESLGVPYATLMWRINHGWNQDSWGIKPNFKNKILRRT